MEILLFKFKGPISNNTENIFLTFFFIYIEILVFKFESPISNIKKMNIFIFSRSGSEYVGGFNRFWALQS